MNGKLKVVTDFSDGLFSGIKNGTEVAVCSGIKRDFRARPSVKLAPLRFDGQTSDFSDSLGIKRIFAFGNYIFGVTARFSLFYSSVNAPGFIRTGISFSALPNMSEITYEGSLAALFYTEKASDSSVIWISPTTSPVILPSVRAADILQAKNRVYAIPSGGASAEYTDSPDVTDRNSEETVSLYSGESGRFGRLITFRSNVLAVSDSSVCKIRGELVPITRLGGISPDSLCRVNEEIYFTAGDGLYKISGDTAAKILGASFSPTAKAVSRGEDIIVISDEKVYLYSTERNFLSQIGQTSASSLVYSRKGDRIVILTTSGGYKQISFGAEDADSESEYSVYTDFSSPHSRKRLNYLSFVGKGEFLLSVSSEEGGKCSQKFSSAGERPKVVPANLVGSRFKISVRAKLAPSAYMRSLAANVNTLGEDDL